MKKVRHITNGKEYEVIDRLKSITYKMDIIIYTDGERVYARDEYMFDKKFQRDINEEIDEILDIHFDDEPLTRKKKVKEMKWLKRLLCNIKLQYYIIIL